MRSEVEEEAGVAEIGTESEVAKATAKDKEIPVDEADSQTANEERHDDSCEQHRTPPEGDGLHVVVVFGIGDDGLIAKHIFSL